MAKKKVIQPVKGTRDFYPEIMAVRKWLYETAAGVAEKFGYQEYEGPLIESLELYAAKSGDELVKEQSFVFEDRGSNLITLRPELTPTLARMVAQRQNQLVFPLRWWSFGPFWRYERPQKGRTREFFQWNIDLIGPGTDTAIADAELIAIIATFFQDVGLAPKDAQILVNNRQLMENEINLLGIPPDAYKTIFRLIDRREKLPLDKWKAYAADLGLDENQVYSLDQLLSDSDLWQKSTTLQELFPVLEAMGVSDYVQFAPSVIRGLDYYTGTVFEAQAVRGGVKRSILGGGRYDNLLADVGGDKIPAVGFAMGDLVITLVLEELGLIPDAIASPPARILVTIFNDDMVVESTALANQLRSSGLRISCYPRADKLSKQLKYADRIEAAIAVLLGPDELDKGLVTLKNLSTGTQDTVDREAAASTLMEMLEDIDSS